MLYNCEEKESEPSQQRSTLSRGRFDTKSLSLIKHFLDHFPPCFCEYNAVNLFCWADIYDYAWFSYKGRLLIYDGKNNISFMPLGCEFTPEELYSLSHELMCKGLSPHLGLVPRSYIDNHPDLHHYFTAEEDRDAAEYIYKIGNLVALKGKRLQKKKNLVSQFHRRYPDHRVLVMDERLRPEVLTFARDLLEAREPVPQSLMEEAVAIEKAFDNWDRLDLEGLVVTVDDNIAAFAVFSPLNLDTFNVHFEKANIAYKGAAQVINQETARYLSDRAVYINREQDLGIPGLRQAKKSYDPHRLLVPWMLKLKANA
ncbi:MAG TPA: hypothetical protein DHV36_20885 [Desulfobacteraceae bacterium]|nr:hypothetical protein [Desulfobacteraceae bacterium]